MSKGWIEVCLTRKGEGLFGFNYRLTGTTDVSTLMLSMRDGVNATTTMEQIRLLDADVTVDHGHRRARRVVPGVTLDDLRLPTAPAKPEVFAELADLLNLGGPADRILAALALNA